MPRPLRNFIPDGIYHVTARGVDRLTIFRDDADRERFLALLEKVVVERGWSCLGYCLMDNHFHLLVRTPAADLAAGMQYVNGQFARWFNNRHGRSGHLFQGRYHHEAVVTDVHLLEVARYIPLNPVRAGMCRTAADWRWSSHNTMVGRVHAAWLDVKDLLARFAGYLGGNPRSPEAYLRYIRDGETEAERRRRAEKRVRPDEVLKPPSKPPPSRDNRRKRRRRRK